MYIYIYVYIYWSLGGVGPPKREMLCKRCVRARVLDRRFALVGLAAGKSFFFCFLFLFFFFPPGVLDWTPPCVLGLCVFVLVCACV